MAEAPVVAVAVAVSRAKRPHALVVIGFGVLASCSAPTKPGPPPPPSVGPATPPIVRSIAVPASRVEAGTDVAITAVVEDAETPLTALAFQWSASAGTIEGTGASATWRVPTGMKAGIDVTVTLTVTDTYDAVENNVVVKRQFVVPSTSAPFRVHDSTAEVKELARKFLVDLFGNTSIPAQACMVDFAEVCANFGEGKNTEVGEIVSHREKVVLTNAEVMHQNVQFFGPGSGVVHTAMNYTGHPTNSLVISSGCGDYELTMVYVGNRWWICESYFHGGDQSFCPSTTNTNSELSRILSEVLKGRGR